jgi:hypothetical protein
MLFRLVAAIAVLWAIGHLALRVFLRKGPKVPLSWRVGFSFGIGLGLQSLAMFYLASLGIRLNALSVGSLTGTLLIVLVVINWTARRHVPVGSGCWGISESWRRLDVLLVSISIVSSLLVIIDTFSQPLIAFDARSIWGMKTRILYFQQGTYVEDFMDSTRLHAHQQYPLLVPLAETFICRFLGQFDDRWGKAIFPGFFLGLQFLFYSTIRQFFGRTYSLVGVAMLSGLPIFVIFANGNAASGYVDFPLAYFVTGFMVALLFWDDTGYPGYLWLASLFGAFALFTKNEGIALWAIVVVCFAVWVGLSSQEPLLKLSHLALSSTVTLLLLVPWFGLRCRYVLNDENYTVLLTLDKLLHGSARLSLVLKAFMREIFFKPHLWNILGILVLATILVSTLKSFRARHTIFLVIPVLYACLLVLILLVTPWRVEDLISVSLSRLLMHTAPLLLIWLFFQVATLEIFPVDWTGRDEDLHLSKGNARHSVPFLGGPESSDLREGKHVRSL